MAPSQLRDEVRRLLLLPALLGLLAAPALALDPSWRITQLAHDYWLVDHGLPQDWIYAVSQTRDGYLWLGTDEGLVRFDGVRFTLFDKRTTPALTSKRIFTLLAARDGGLWIGTHGGGVVRLRDGAFSMVSPAGGQIRESVWAFAEDATGLWIGTRDQGLRRVEAGRVSSFGTAEGLPQGSILALVAAPDGMLYVATDGSGLGRIHDQRFEGLLAGHPRLAIVTALCRDAKGRLWAGTDGRGLFRIEGDAVTASFDAGRGLPSPYITSLLEDRDGSLWVGTMAGLARIHEDRVDSYATAEGFSQNVSALFEDAEGSLWIGTQGGGLHRLREPRFLQFGRPEGLPHDAAWSLHEDASGAIWVGTFGGGLALMKDGRIQVFGIEQGLPHGNVWSLAGTAAGALYAGTDGGGLTRIQDGHITTLRERDGLASGVVWSLCAARDGALWIGTDRGLQRLEKGRLRKYGPDDGLTSEFVRALLESRDGTLWVGTEGGGLCAGREGRFHCLGSADGLASPFVRSLYEDDDGVLWIGTDGGGLSRLEGKRLRTFTTNDGLPDDVVWTIVDDGLGNLWTTSNRGIARMRKADLAAFVPGEGQRLTVVNYDRGDGLRSAEASSGSPAAIRTRDGRLWFALARGLAVINPRALGGPAPPPPVLIESVVTGARSLSARSALELGSGERRFEVRYTALSLIAPNRVRFKYRLDGFDADWIDAEARRVAYYTNVPPGHYRFHVIAANHDGVWNQTGAALDLTILPRFYETWPFLAGLGAGAALTVFGVHRLRTRSLKARAAELGRMVQERTQQLEEHARQLAEANATLTQLTASDDLTGIANRRRFDEALEQEWRRARRASQPLSLIMIDIDAFKAFNDRYGHQRGDACLRSVAQTLASSLGRAGDLVARYGGDEFAVIQADTDAAGSKRVAEAMRRAVEELRIPHDDAVVTVSLGAATLVPGQNGSPADLIAASDDALYRAKRAGRNRAVSADA